jgi:hypothetical protein
MKFQEWICINANQQKSSEEQKRLKQSQNVEEEKNSPNWKAACDRCI